MGRRLCPPPIRGITMLARSIPIAILLLFCASTGSALAEEPSARELAFHGYAKAAELRPANARAVFRPQAGGRVRGFSVAGIDAMYLDDADKNWQPGKPAPTSAGRAPTLSIWRSP